MTNEIKTVEELEEEFTTRLKEMHPYFKELKSTSDDSKLCQKWLHKLFKIKGPEISLRNVYLDKLTEQVKKGRLEAPFDKPPVRKERLLPLNTHMTCMPMQFNAVRNETTKPQMYNPVWEVLNGNFLNEDKHLTRVQSKNHNNKVTENNTKKEKMFNDDGISNNSKEAQQQKPISDKSEGGDGCTMNHEVKMKLESFEKMVEEIKIENDLIVNQLREFESNGHTNDTSRTDQVASINAELIKVKNDMNELIRLETNVESENMKRFEILIEKYNTINSRIDEFISEVRYMNDQVVNNTMKSVEYIKEEKSKRLIEKRSHPDKQMTIAVRKRVDSANACADDATTEVGIAGEVDTSEDDDGFETVTYSNMSLVSDNDI